MCVYHIISCVTARCLTRTVSKVLTVCPCSSGGDSESPGVQKMLLDAVKRGNAAKVKLVTYSTVSLVSCGQS